MSSLTRLQQRFQHRVLAGTVDDAQWAEVTGHLEVYIHAYQGRMRAALASNYPVLYRALGEEAFGALTRAYCCAQPSQHRSIRWLGDGLLTFLSTTPAPVPHPALLDIARMDWAMRHAFDAADAPCLQLEDLRGLATHDWPALTLQTVPSFQLLELQWGVQSLWHALHTDEQAQTPEPVRAPQSLVVWRQQLECRWRSVEAAEHLALRLLQQKAPFATLCQALQEAGDTAAEHKAATLLMTWVSEGLLAQS